MKTKWNDTCHCISSVAPRRRWYEAFKKNNLPENLMYLLDYFDAYYVNDENNIRFQKLPSMYPPIVWNVNNTTLIDCHRTNNIVEEWSNRFMKDITSWSKTSNNMKSYKKN